MQVNIQDRSLNEGDNRLRFWKSHPLVSYFVLAYAISWLTLGLVALGSQGLLPFHLPSVITFFSEIVGSIGPLLAALLLVAMTTGKAGMRAFFRQWLIWRVGFRWYLFVLFEPIMATALAIVCSSLLGGASFNFTHPAVIHLLGLPGGIIPWALFVPVFFLGGLVGGPLGEEPGWRGYALVKLQGRYSALVASLILGVLWTVWHLPFFFIKGTTESTTPFLVFALCTVANSILFTWVFNHTRGSVLMTFLFHTALNNTALYLPLSLWDDWRGVVIQCLVALVVVLVAIPKRRAQPTPHEQMPTSFDLEGGRGRGGSLPTQN